MPRKQKRDWAILKAEALTTKFSDDMEEYNISGYIYQQCKEPPRLEEYIASALRRAERRGYEKTLSKLPRA